MKKYSKIISLVVLVCSIAAICSSCYVSSGLEPKTANVSYVEKVHNTWMYNTELKFLTSYSEYEALGINLGYSEVFWENNSLLIFLRTGCSTDNLQFVDVRERDGKLYPVIEINPYGPNDPATDDIIYYAFYVEVPNSANYSIGEIITKTRARKVLL